MKYVFTKYSYPISCWQIVKFHDDTSNGVLVNTSNNIPPHTIPGCLNDWCNMSGSFWQDFVYDSMEELVAEHFEVFL